MVFIVKHNRMPKESIDVCEAPMLDPSTGSGSTAHILFVGESTKNNDAALTWVTNNIVLPFITSVRARAGKNAATPASLSVDGDPRQLQVLAEEVMQAAFREANIILSKTPASCTPIFQPLDAGKLFLAMKNLFDSMIMDGYKHENAQEWDSLLAIFKGHLERFPEKTLKNKKPSKAMPRYFNDVMKCLLAGAVAVRKALKGSVVTDSFKITGVSPTDTQTIRNLCQFSWSREDKENFDRAVPVLADILKTNFELKEKDFDDVEIPSNNGNKDGLSISTSSRPACDR
jgi:hypothetical protein